ncbi:General transcription factor 3C polypeptide 3 [Galdieria sulphuraria]|uniref:RNA polymerase III transcription factor TFIIIC-like protein n=1 Tax=Galdieria sulphuraria TaxID=130081 RepID=M2XTF9_GALSU|nr:RNA polymerase III transcription factor TFIIIC-like protein [Galdieria sulphuraria]EME26724.1 RNA polymerase III transcription factor TFIIIC-like protein [Galdieria sulphuraria]GJD06998.1 General transcription factor 3C polypeptide 3 [Galdieria sulphuraria]|eukprot:XP_005703244.1 RNA polymerase III transcription factor TFIIIC-like protein [Galdieria sulphuraria]
MSFYVWQSELNRKLDAFPFETSESDETNSVHSSDSIEQPTIVSQYLPWTIEEDDTQEQDTVSRRQVFGASVSDIREEWPRKKGGRKSSTSSTVPKNLQSFMGEANLAFVEGRYEQAIEILEHIIKEAPKVAAPYHTLSVIFENKGETQKALDFALIAAHLTPRDIDMWKQLAVKSQELKNLDLAIYCLSKAVKASGGKDEQALRARANLYIIKRDWRRAAQGLEKVARMYPKDIALALQVAQYYYDAEYPIHAIQVLQHTLDNVDEFSLELYQMQSRLLMEENEYERAAALLSHARFHFFLKEEMPFDLQVNYAICYIRLGQPHVADKIRRYLLQHLEQTPFYLKQLADAYTDSGYVEEAMEICRKLLTLNVENEEEIFLNLGRCCKILQHFDEALGWYEKVLSKDPNRLEACLGMSYIYEQMGELDKAAELVSKMQNISGKHRGERLEAIYTYASETVKSILDRAERYYSEGRLLDFVEAILPLLEASADPRMRTRIQEETNTLQQVPLLGQGDKGKEEVTEPDEISNHSSSSHFLLTFRKSKDKKERNWEKKEIQFGVAEMGSVISTILGESAFVHLLERCWRSMCELGRNAEACRLVRSLIQSGQIQNENDRKRLHIFAVAGAYDGKDYEGAYEGLRNLCLERPYSVSIWALLMRTSFLGSKEDTKTLKFAIRLLHRHPTSIPAILVTAHICSMRGSFGYALAEYFRAFGHLPKHPLPCLCIGLQYLFSAMSRRVANRHRTVLEAFTFLFHYSTLRKEQWSSHSHLALMETKYNIARAFHFLGIFHQASVFYREILCMDCSIPASHDLRREAAYNLAHIYCRSGSVDLARDLLRTYVTL